MCSLAHSIQRPLSLPKNANPKYWSPSPSNCQAKQACIHSHTHSTPKTENHKQHVHAYMVSRAEGAPQQGTTHSTVQHDTAHANRPKPGLRPILKVLSNTSPRPYRSCKNRKNIIHRWIGRVPKRLGEKSSVWTHALENRGSQIRKDFSLIEKVQNYEGSKSENSVGIGSRALFTRHDSKKIPQPNMTQTL